MSGDRVSAPAGTSGAGATPARPRRGWREGLLCLAVAWAWPLAAAAQPVTFDASAGAASGKPNVTSLTWSHTVGAGTARILIVGVSMRDGQGAVTGVTYGGAPLTQAGFQVSGGQRVRVELWELVAPASGTADVVVSLSAAKQVVGGSASFSGVDPAVPHGPFASAIGKSTTASVTLPSAPGELVLDAVATPGNADGLTAGAGQTPRWNLFSDNGGGGDARGAGSTAPGAASVAMSWTLVKKKDWAIGAIALRPVTPPSITLVKSVAPLGSQPPNADLAYTAVFTNGLSVAYNVQITDPVPDDSDFKVGSAGANLGSTGLGLTLSYSDDGGATWVYVPASGGGGAPAGYDRNVTHVRWDLSGALSPNAPDNTGDVFMTVRIR